MKYIEISYTTLRFEKKPGEFLLHCYKYFSDRFEGRGENLIMMHKNEFDSLRVLVDVLIKECVEHNNEYHHHTSKELLKYARDMVAID